MDGSAVACKNARRGARTTEGHPLLTPDASTLIAGSRAAALCRQIAALGVSAQYQANFNDIAATLRRSHARVLVLDARDDPAGALDALYKIRTLEGERDLVSIIVLRQGDHDSLSHALESGITHFLLAPVRPIELAQSIRAARAVSHRLLAARTARALSVAQAVDQELPRWALDAERGLVGLSGDLQNIMTTEAGRGWSVRGILRNTPAEERRVLLRKIRMLFAEGGSTTATHTLTVGNRRLALAHHISAQRDASGRVRTLLATVEDRDAATSREQLHAHFDPLTGLAAQSYARAWLRQHIENAPQENYAVIEIAVARFGHINAAYGRETAEALLQALARRLRRLALSEDADASEALLARLSGAEFALIVAAGGAEEEALEWAIQLAQAFERPFVVYGRAIHLSCRIGIALGLAHHQNMETMFRQADLALARARRLGPNGIQIFTAEHEHHAATLISLETDLRVAVQANALDLAFQPQVDLGTNRIVGLEALVRWSHPVLGDIDPETVLSVAQNAEIEAEVAEAIIRLALSQAASWTEPALTTLRLSVNVLPSQIQCPDFDRRLQRILHDTGFPPDRLTLEVTESGLVDDLDVASEMIESLHGMGVRIALDDFGTGYSSLAYLRALPLDCLKVDRRFVTDLAATGRDRIVVHGVIEMARALGISVVAEGVETQAQRALLAREGCDWYQGYLCTPPLRPEALKTFCAQWAP
ncbi:MAG: GGDEF and EAL domain-containing protein [Sphingomonadales bacterium]|nr:MAG: GGDEF and EAL domain-containing protein [Sphingomonadales bacterium]